MAMSKCLAHNRHWTASSSSATWSSGKLPSS